MREEVVSCGTVERVVDLGEGNFRKTRPCPLIQQVASTLQRNASGEVWLRVFQVVYFLYFTALFDHILFFLIDLQTMAPPPYVFLLPVDV